MQSVYSVALLGFVFVTVFVETLNGKGQGESPWFMGCFNVSASRPGSLDAAMHGGDLDPVTCLKRCLDEGYRFAALTSESCYCGNGLVGLEMSECFNTSSQGGPEDVTGLSAEKRTFESVYLPRGDGQGNFAVYRSKGPFLHNISLASSPDEVQAGIPFIMEVSGNLAGAPHQPTGIGGLGGHNLSYVTVEFSGRSSKGHSSHRVTLLDDGFFSVSVDWILEAPGKYQINVSVSNPLSKLSSTLPLAVLQLSPEGLVISVLHGPLGVPSCIPSMEMDTQSGAVRTAYLGDSLTLQAYIGEGFRVEFCWQFTHKKREKKEAVVEERKSVKTDCLPDSDCLSSVVNWTFETEGVHTVSVNASSVYGWKQETVHIVVVRLAVSDLTVSVSGYQLSAGEDISVDVELFTTIKHRLLLNLTLSTEYSHSCGHSNDHSSEGKGTDNSSHSRIDSNDNTNNMNGKNSDDNSNSNYDGKIEDHESNIKGHNSSNTEYSNYGNSNSYDQGNDPEYDDDISQHDNNPVGKNLIHIADISYNQSHGCDGADYSTHSHAVSFSLPDTHTLSLSADRQHFIPLHLFHPCGQSSCHLHLRLHCRLPNAAGQYHLLASVFSTAAPSPALLPTAPPPVLMLYERIHALWPSGSWSSVVPAQSEFKLEVVSHANRMGSRVAWTFSLDDAIVVNRTTEEWTINVSLSIAGRYKVTVKAFNPISWASFFTHFLVQDIVGGLLLNVPSAVTMTQPTSVLFTVTAGSNVTVALLVNATLVYRNSSYTTGEEAAVVLLFHHSGTAEIVLRAENLVSSQNRTVSVYVKRNQERSPPVSINTVWPRNTRQSPVHSRAVSAVTIHAEKQAYPTNVDITFLAVADEPDPLEFLWYFGDSGPVRTTSRTITKRYHTPGRYSVVVVLSSALTSIKSEVFPLLVQRAVQISRLVHRASVLQNQTVSVSCRVNVGTDLTYLWNFGDGTSRLGQNTEQHVFHRLGEFRVEVTVSNLVSSAFMSSHIFVVDRPCQPPPVKNMGPLKIQVRRYEVIHLGVTYESEVDCDMSGGLHYTWTLYDSAGQAFPLPPIVRHKQSITLPSHFLQHDIYTAVARVQIVGSVVYSNYTMRVEVVPSPPVAFIQGGTNIFINNKNTTMVTLDGQRSHDPDFPTSPISYSWRCKPVSSIISPCFNQYVPTSSSVLTFPASFLKRNFDQFQFTLTVGSGERSASSETFLTVTPNLIRKVSVYCLQCQGDQVNWDQAFSVTAVCESCDVSPKDIQYTWSLYLVNASSKPVIEVPFCHTVDLSAPSTVSGGPAAPVLTPGTTSQLESVTKTPAMGLMQNINSGTSSIMSENMSSSTADVSSIVTKDAETQTANPTYGSLDTMPVFPPFPLLSEPPSEDSQFPSGRPWKQRLAKETDGLTLSVQMENPTPSPNLTSPFSSSYNAAVLADPEPSTTYSSSPVNSRQRTAVSGEEPYYRALDPAEPLYPSSEYPPVLLDNRSIVYSVPFGDSDIISELPTDFGSHVDSDYAFTFLESGDTGGRLEVGLKPNEAPVRLSGNETGNSNNTVESFTDSDYDGPFLDAVEGDPGISEGRPTGVGGESSGLGGDSGFDPESVEDEGSNLVDSSPSLVFREPTSLDLPRHPVERGLFESYTDTGISSPLLSFKRFSLRPGSRYMLEVTAKSHNTFLGRTQLLLTTSPAPKGMICQVQPSKGVEIHTHFSIFCTSGKQDLLYEYSFSIGDSPPRTLYQGRDFQYYFSLPSGDSSDDYKVTIYTEIRNGRFGTATKPCPVTVQVQPSFHRNTSSHSDPDLELSESGLRNLSALVQLGNNVEIRNYISLLSSILNRLSMDTSANTHAQTHMRSVLISTVCELEISDQTSMVDNIFVLENLLQVTHQVTLVRARQVRDHIQAISERFVKSSVPVLYHLDHKTVHTLVTLLSYSLQAATTANDITPEMPNADDIMQAPAAADYLLSDSSNSGNITKATAAPVGHPPDSPTGVNIRQGKAFPAEQVVQLVTDSLQVAADLLLKYILFSKAQENSVSTGFMALHAAYRNQTSNIISGGSATYYLPDSLNQLLLSPNAVKTKNGQRPCVLSLLSEFKHSPYSWASTPAQLSGPVVDLSLYKCRTRRKIPVHSLLQPINIKFQTKPRNKSSVTEYILLRSQVSYHSLNITQQHLHQTIQLSVVFTPPPNKTFPIMLLFRMFERPNPSLYHLHRIHQWEGNTTRITLPPYYLNAAGVGYLALLNADYGKPFRHKYLSSHVGYSLKLESSLCLSWDGHQGAWTHHGCTTQQGDSTAAVSCSCTQLRPLTVVQQQIQSSHDTADLDQFLSVASDLTVVGVLVLCVCLYTLALVVCKRADMVSEKGQRVHYLPDNSPSDPYLYAVTVHTGLYSAANMSAKVYIVLYGENGFSQTKELQVPECILFRRNSQDTFILRTTDSLGPLWGVHLWHDNSGPCPSWYLKQVEVSEMNQGHVKGRTWLFLGQCWLSVSQSDGQVNRRLRVCAQGIGFAKVLCLKLSDYLADFHLWMSVYSRPSHSSFTHTQRLSVCLLLVLGYACVNTLLISQMEDQFTVELGLIDVSAVSVTTGVFSALAVLPVATLISFLFRLREVKVMESKVKLERSREPENYSFEDAPLVNDNVLESHLSWSGLQQWAQDAWRKKYQGQDLVSMSSRDLASKDKDEEPVIQRDLVTRKEGVLEMQNSRDLALHDLITEGTDADQVPQGKERDLESQSSRNDVTQTSWRDWNLVVRTNHRNLVTTGSRDLVPPKELVTQWEPSKRNGSQLIHSNLDVETSGNSEINRDLVIQMEKDPVKSSSDSGFEDSNGFLSTMLGTRHQANSSWECHVSNTLAVSGVRVKPRPHWCHHLAWALSLLLSLCCLTLSAVLGIRFSRSKALLWMHSLFFSLLSCIFLIQPAMILVVAVTVSFWYRNRADFYNFSGIKGFEIQAFELRSHNGCDRPQELSPSASLQERCSYLEKQLVARQRARYLRLVRPPAPPELKKTRGKKRKETLIHKTLRELSLHIPMLVLLLCITYGGSFSDYYHLNKAVRLHFTRDHQNSFLSIQNHDDWWKWSQTSLLNVLYKKGSATAKVSVIQETYVLIGEPLLWKTEMSNSSQCQGVEFVSAQVSGGTAGLIPECLPGLWSGIRDSSHPHSALMFPTAAAQQMCGRLSCYAGPSATIGLGLTRSEAVSKLKFLRSGGWLARRTVALKVQITLYSPAPNLFTSVTLLTEQSPTGVLLPSVSVQSVRIYHAPSTWDYVVMVCQLLFLLLSLLQLCRQVHSVGQQGLMGYCRAPCNWLEVSLLTVILVYYVYCICRSVKTLEAVDLLQRNDYRGHVDVSDLAIWEQHVRALRGVMLFLLSVKCVAALGASRTVAASAAVLTQSLYSLFWPTVSGLILQAALSCVGNLLFIQRSWAFSSLQTLLAHCRGLRPVRRLFLSGHGAPGSLSDYVYWVVLCLTSTVVWTVVVRCVVSSSVRAAKRAHCRRDVCTLAEIVTYIRHRVSVLTGQHRPRWTDNHTERRNYYLEEFESLVDELLFRLNTLSNSLHHTLPPKSHRYKEDSPSISPIQKASSVDTQCFVRTHMAEETIVNDHMDISDLCLSNCGENSPASHLLRSQTELDKVQIQRDQSKDSLSSDRVVVSDLPLQAGSRSEGNQAKSKAPPKDGELQISLRGQNCLSLPESVSPKGAWTAEQFHSGRSVAQLVQSDVPENQANQWTKTTIGCWFSKAANRSLSKSRTDSHLGTVATRHTQSEVVVEVLVHEKPGSGELVNQRDPLYPQLEPV